MNKSILCVSGGLDSYLAWEYLSRPATVFFNARHKYALKELSVMFQKSSINKSIFK